MLLALKLNSICVNQLLRNAEISLKQKLDQKDLNPNIANMEHLKYTRGTLLAYLLLELQTDGRLNTLETLEKLLTRDVVAYCMARAELQHIVYCLWIYHEFPKDLMDTLPKLFVAIPILDSYLHKLNSRQLPFSIGDDEEVWRMNHLYSDLRVLMVWYVK